ncbi:hypothetical protein [uncultured Demequina sp.]|uniref:hypothetical protein n=1 Tax=uncultured Demequina sp. TaxID=693499 RepID=UPI00345C5BFC
MKTRPDLSALIKSYDVRGIVGETLTPEVARAIGAAFADAVVLPDGETEVVIGRDMRDSGPALVTAVGDGLRDRGVDAPIFVCQASYRLGQTNPAILAAQSGIVNPRAGIYAGPNTDLLGADYRYDDAHLSADGQDRFAAMLVASMLAAESRDTSISAAG